MLGWEFLVQISRLWNYSRFNRSDYSCFWRGMRGSSEGITASWNTLEPTIKGVNDVKRCFIFLWDEPLICIQCSIDTRDHDNHYKNKNWVYNWLKYFSVRVVYNIWCRQTIKVSRMQHIIWRYWHWGKGVAIERWKIHAQRDLWWELLTTLKEISNCDN